MMRAKKSVQYNENATMKLIGAEKRGVMAVMNGGEACKQFRDVLSVNRAHPEREYFDVALDFFTLGMIYGLHLDRAELARKAKTRRKPNGTTTPKQAARKS